MRNINELIDYLQGTCKSLEEGCQEVFGISSDELTVKETNDLDMAIFLCEECGWWFEISEMSDELNGEQICNDCHNED